LIPALNCARTMGLLSTLNQRQGQSRDLYHSQSIYFSSYILSAAGGISFTVPEYAKGIAPSLHTCTWLSIILTILSREEGSIVVDLDAENTD
jgi:hypothetical protein